MSNLFNQKIITERVNNFHVSNFQKKLDVIIKWSEAFKNGSLVRKTETQCEQAFNQDFFIQLLGYKPFPSTPYSIDPKATVDVGSQKPDAALGWFNSDNNSASVVVEIKDSNTSLDKPQRRAGNLSPVQQAFKYKPLYKNCRFVIVTNFLEIRLYYSNQLDFEVFLLKELTNKSDDYFQLRKLIFLLNEGNLISKKGISKTEELISEYRDEQLEITTRFYNQYRKIRLELMRDIWKNNKENRHINFVTSKAQKLLDRFVFVCFCEDSGLLPTNSLDKSYEHAASGYGSVWSNLKLFFKDIDTGSDKLDIPSGYNGGLFKTDIELDNLVISDEALNFLRDISKYDFNDSLTVNILGHIFEQSIADIEELKKKVDPEEIETSTKRKKDGIYYTPDHVVDYIVRNTLGVYLENKQLEIFDKHKLNMAKTNESINKRETDALVEYQALLQSIKIVDPACGSGAFLVKAFDYLLEENRRIGNILGGFFDKDQTYKDILSNNIFGVDLNEESVEISKLSLWLKTAEKGKKLTFLDQNIQCGNSLISNTFIGGSKAFNWKTRFDINNPEGTFDVVIGNPPYVDSETMVKENKIQRDHITREYESASGNWDLYIPFIEKGLSLLKKGGYLGYINPNKILSIDYGDKLRKIILRDYGIESITYLNEEKIFKDADVYPIVNIFTNQTLKNSKFKPSIDSVPNIISTSDIDFKSWAKYLHPKSWILKSIKGSRLDSKANVYSSATVNEAYDLPSLLRNTGKYKVVNTGTIDKYISRWDLDEMHYLKQKYNQPYVNREGYLNRKEWLDNQKIIVAGMAKCIEAMADPNGSYLGTKSTTVIVPKNNEDFWYLLGYLNSNFASILFEIDNFSEGMAGGYMNVNQNNLSNLVLIDIDSSAKDIISRTAETIFKKQTLLTKELLNFKNVITSEYPDFKWTKTSYSSIKGEFSGFITKLHIGVDLNKKMELSDFFESHKRMTILLENEISELLKVIDETLLKECHLIDSMNLLIAGKP